MTREEIKIELKRLVSNLKSMADEYEDLLNEMDNLSDAEFDAKVTHIEDIYSEYGIELF